MGEVDFVDDTRRYEKDIVLFLRERDGDVLEGPLKNGLFVIDVNQILIG